MNGCLAAGVDALPNASLHLAGRKTWESAAGREPGWHAPSETASACFESLPLRPKHSHRRRWRSRCLGASLRRPCLPFRVESMQLPQAAGCAEPSAKKVNSQPRNNVHGLGVCRHWFSVSVFWICLTVGLCASRGTCACVNLAFPGSASHVRAQRRAARAASSGHIAWGSAKLGMYSHVLLRPVTPPMHLYCCVTCRNGATVSGTWLLTWACWCSCGASEAAG